LSRVFGFSSGFGVPSPRQFASFRQIPLHFLQDIQSFCILIFEAGLGPTPVCPSPTCLYLKTRALSTNTLCTQNDLYDLKVQFKV